MHNRSLQSIFGRSTLKRGQIRLKQKQGSRPTFLSLAAQSGHSVDIRKPFRYVVRSAGLDPYGVVRHTAITHLVQAGVYLLTVKRISEHKTLIMVERLCTPEWCTRSCGNGCSASALYTPSPRDGPAPVAATISAQLHRNYTESKKACSYKLCKPLI